MHYFWPPFAPHGKQDDIKAMKSSTKALAGFVVLALAIGIGWSSSLAAPPVTDPSSYNRQNVAPGVSGNLPYGASTNSPPGVTTALPPGVSNKQFSH
jgi:hypothetical protein